MQRCVIYCNDFWLRDVELDVEARAREHNLQEASDKMLSYDITYQL